MKQRKKRILSLFLAFAMLIAGFPQGVLTARAEDVIVIRTAEELAALGGGYSTLEGNYRLDADLDMSGISMTPVYRFNGVFDGNGHTIKNLSITSGSNAGLFGTINGGTICNLTIADSSVTQTGSSNAVGMLAGKITSAATISGVVTNNCTVTTTGASSYNYTGGLVGQVNATSSSAVQFENCGVIGGTVQNTYTSGQYTGGFIGYASYCSSLQFESCCTTAAVTGYKYTGGFIGYCYTKAFFTNCYAAGSTNATASYSPYAGGFAGYLYNSGSSYAATFENCYCGGAFTCGASSSADAFAYFYNSGSSYKTLTNCCYDPAQNTVSAAQSGAEAKDVITAADMGDAYQEDVVAQNNGYPILAWQYHDPDARYDLSVAVTPADAQLTLEKDGSAANAVPVYADGVYTYTDLEQGVYTYTVSQNETADTDYAPFSGSVTIKNKDVSLEVTLVPREYETVLTVTPADAQLTVTDENGAAVSGTHTDNTYTYSLPNGTYHYTASSFGYETGSGEFTVNRQALSKEITLQPAACRQITFAFSGGTFADIASPSITVVSDTHTMQPTDENGLVFSLPLGYCYSYTFRSANYAKVSGSIDLTETTDTAPVTETIALTVKTAWEGADDLIEPAQKDGIYQIGTGSELAWFAAHVNDGASDIAGVLTKDIDLGGFEWTPIGSSSAYYMGSFDGGGHTISNLNISDGANVGLFGAIGSTASVSDFTVSGSVNGRSAVGGAVGANNGGAVSKVINMASVSASSSNAGGIVGNNTGSVTDCTNKGTVDSTSQYAGGITGRSNNGTISRSVNEAGVSSSYSSYAYVGGIAGQLSGGVISDCVNTGAVSAPNAGYAYAGGITGYTGGSYYSYATVQNVYNAGTVTGKNYLGGITGYFSNYTAMSYAYNRGTVTGTGSNVGELAGYQYGSSKTVSNLFYDTTSSTGKACGSGDLDASGVEGRTGMSAIINAADEENHFISDSGINDGWPILNWQDTTPRYDALISVSPSEAEIVLSDASGNSFLGVKEGAQYLFKLPEGDYTYTASAYGYENASGTLTVTAEGASAQITLKKLATHKLAFAVSPSEAVPVITVSYENRVISPETDGSYLLAEGYTYQYVVKAKGYAKQTGSLHCTGDDTISVTLLPSLAWDGEEIDTEWYTQGAERYEIGSGAELAGLAKLVNAGTDFSGITIVLTDNIDLGDQEWTPAGTYSHAFSGSFDGGGHTIRNLKITDSAESYVGLFGYLRNASIENLIVRGAVSGSGTAIGGIAGRADGSTFTNCGSEAAICGTGSYRKLGGILGEAYNNDCSLTRCYNRGTISSEAANYIGGIAGGAGSFDTFTDCYNSGTLSGSYYTAGICASGGNAFTRCINTGSLTGNTTGAIGNAGYADYTDCFYLDSTISASANGTAQTEAQLKAESFLEKLNKEGTAWKADGAEECSVNAGFPVLAWEKLPDPIKLVLAVPAHVGWAPEKEALAVWDAVENADSYTVELLYDRITVTQTTEGAVTSYDVTSLTTIEGITETSYDFASLINDAIAAGKAQDNTCYYLKVTAVAAAGSKYTDSEPSAIDYFDKGCLWHSNRLSVPQNLRWDDAFATWTPVSGAAAYIVTLYREGGAEGSAEYTASGIVDGSCILDNLAQLDCTPYFSAGGRYFFTVTAISQAYLDTGEEDKNSECSANSPVYTAKAPVPPEPSEEHGDGWTAITTAEQFIDLANVEDTPVSDDDPTSQQAVFWSKKYYLANDIDFSGLSVAYAAKAKAIGTVTYPFTGVFDGNGKKITGLSLSGTDCGLFQYIGYSGLVCNLTVENPNAQFSDNAGIVANNNYGTITDCAVINPNITADTGAVIGGFVSRNYGIIRRCYVLSGSLTANSTTATGQAGFAGANETGALIEQCYTTMPVRTKSNYAGGFVGLGYGGTIRDCFTLSDVTAAGYSGGFVGRSVYNGNRYQNCYAGGTVTVSGMEGNGFIGGSLPDSAFQYDQSEGIENCYYRGDLNPGGNPYGAVPKTLAEMQADTFLLALGGTGSNWLLMKEQNNGLPYLRALPAPKQLSTDTITVSLLAGVYDKNTYGFSAQNGMQPIRISFKTTGNSTVLQVMEEAKKQGLLDFTYSISTAYGGFIESINGLQLNQPDGWMFTVNDQLSTRSASLTTVADGDQILWYEGTTQNLYHAPTWTQLTTGDSTIWTDISTVDQLLRIGQDDAWPLDGAYRLIANLDLSDIEFAGIGSENAPFTGKFDGLGHTISNMHLTSDARCCGFFNCIFGAQITNLNLTAAAVTSTYAPNSQAPGMCGLLAGYAKTALSDLSSNDNTGNLIGNCQVNGAITANGYTGGLVGVNDGAADAKTGNSVYSAIDGCRAQVTVSTTFSGAGGLVGSNLGTITGSSASGHVTTSATLAGGLAGNNFGSIYDSFSAAAVTATDYAGGLLGAGDGTVKRCYSLGTVTGTSDALNTHLGGFVGSGSGIFDTCVGACIVNGSKNATIGGFAGQYSGTLTGLESNITMKNCFGYCPDGLFAIGNKTASTVETEQEILDGMRLLTRAARNDKLYELFGVRLTDADDYDLSAIASAISEKLADTLVMDGNTAWIVADLMAFDATLLSDSQKQAYVNYAVAELAKTDSAGDLAKHILALKALGYDASRIVTVNQPEGTYFNAVEKLQAQIKAGSVTSIYTLPYVLIALQQDPSYADDALIQTLVDAILSHRTEILGDADIMAPVLLALAPYTEENEAVKELTETALARVSSFQTGISGAVSSYGTENAASTGLMIAAACANDIDAAALKNANGCSLLDGLLSFLNTEQNGFLYDGTDSPFATEQGLRGLLAQLGCQIYDFSQNGSAPATATDDGQGGLPDDPVADEQIQVTFSLKGNDGYWIRPEAVTVPADATVRYVFTKVLDAQGYTYTGIENGYVASVTSPDGVTLGQFTEGARSGWLYKVNDTLANIGCSQYALHDGDAIVWYFTTDWTVEPSVVQNVIDLIDAIGTVTYTDACKLIIDTAQDAYDKLTEEEKSYITNVQTLLDAQAAYARLQAEAEQRLEDLSAAQAVDEQIAAIGTVTLASEPDILAARTAYDALTDAQRLLVTQLQTLEAAEKALEALKQTPAILYGDVDNSNMVTAQDALLALKAVVGLTVLSDTQFEAADVDGSQQITAEDALYILKYVVHLISCFPVEQI